MKKKIQAILCDLDGVVTQTASVHAEAWKEMFDSFLEQYAKENNLPFEAFDITTEYYKYVDGKARHEGIRSFLKARNIELPEGEEDSLKPSIHSLGKQKNERFQALLRQGVKTFPRSVEQLQKWKAKGYKIGVVSSSKNCLKILETAGLQDLFDVRVDGLIAEEQSMKGKPAADTFAYAAEMLKIKPQQIAVIEDAAVGIEAAKNGGFGLSIGILNEKNLKEIQAAAPDAMIHDLQQLSWKEACMRYPVDYEQLPDACIDLQALLKMLDRRQLALFLDYDGTLTPIASSPEKAILSTETRQILQLLAQKIKITIISGRDKEDVRNKVGLKELFYAGSHGFDIEGPEHTQIHHQAGEKYMADIRKIAEELEEKLRFKGLFIEPKKYAVAIHYRHVAAEEVGELKQEVQKILEHYPDLKTGKGKKIIEVRPAMEWDKGYAMNWIAAALEVAPDNSLQLYIGDDLTDEDAFRALPYEGIGILTGFHDAPTYADMKVKDTDEVRQLLKALNEIL